MMKYRLQVIAHALNKRSRVPASLPDDAGIVGVVLHGFSFIGERVIPAELNGTAERWYKDRDGYFYMGRWLIETEEFPSSLQVVEEVKAAPVKAAPPSVLPGWLTSLGIDQIWNTTQGESVKVAVLDTGYNISNPDIAEGVMDSKAFNTLAGNPDTIQDIFGHGSHCASLIAGRNQLSFTSCAPKANLYIAKICAQGSVKKYAVIVNAIKWSIEKQVDIISISYGGESTNADLEAIVKSAVQDHNIIVVASIGDKIPGAANLPCYPALFEDCIAVGATNDQKQIAPVTILDNKTEINAPGQDIPGYTLSTTLEKLTGTSQAAAIVAGVCALIIARYRQKGKNYTVKEIRDSLIQNADMIVGSPNQKLINPLKIFQAI